MTPDLLSGPLAQAIGLALLHTVWQGAMVAGLLAAMLALLRNRSASLRYAVSCAALATLFLLAIATAWVAYTPETTVSVQPPVVPAGAIVISAAAPGASWQDRARALVDAARSFVPQIVIAWLAGVLLLSIRLGVSWWRVQSLALRGSIEADAPLQNAARRLADALGLRRAVRLVVSSAVEVPSVVGFVRPVVLLAVSSVSGLTPEQLEMVLAHELAHIRRHDFLVNAIQSVVETLLFFNPAVWMMSRRIRIERENCCDDLAVAVCGDAVAYARTLAQLESMRSAPLAAAAANGGSLADRVRRLVRGQSERAFFSNGWTAAASITGFVVLLGLATAPLFGGGLADDAVPQTQSQTAGAEVDVNAPPKTPAAAPLPAKPKAKKAHPRHSEFDFDFDFDIPDVPEFPQPPIPPDFPERARAFAAAGPRIREEVRASLEAALAGMDDNGRDASTTPPGKLSVNDLIALKTQGVTPEYIEQMRSAGLGDLPIRDIIAMKMSGVTPEYVRELRAAGYDHLSVHDIIRLKTFGVNSDFIREMSKYKTK